MLDLSILSSEVEYSINQSNYSELDSLLSLNEKWIDSLQSGGKFILQYAAKRLDLGAMAVILSHRSGEFVGGYEQLILKATIFSLVSSQWVHLSSKDSVISRVIIVKGLEMLMKNGLDSNFVPDAWMADPLFVAQKNNGNL